MPSVLKVNEVQSDTDLPLVFNVGNAERGRIDTSGNMGLGTTSPSSFAKLTVFGNGSVLGLSGANAIGSSYINFYANSGATNIGYIGFGSGVANTMQVWNSSNEALQFATNNTERMRLDANGQLAFGSTTNPWSSSFSRAIYIEAGSGKPGAVAVGTAAWTAGRSIWMTNNAYTSSAGTFRYVSSGGSGVGLLQVGNDSLTFSGAASGTADTDITFTQVFDVARDNTLCLQGATRQTGTGITFPNVQNASSNVNTLDDYEEGTWTPSSLISVTGAAGRYTKIGRVVQWSCTFTYAASASGLHAYIGGLPFTCENANAARAGSVISYTDYGSSNITVLFNVNDVSAFFYNYSATALTYANLSGKTIFCGGTYITNT